jgi:hypothetical protein
MWRESQEGPAHTCLSSFRPGTCVFTRATLGVSCRDRHQRVLSAFTTTRHQLSLLLQKRSSALWPSSLLFMSDATRWQDTITLVGVKTLLQDHDCSSAYLKYLAPNDNSKNQIYIGTDISAGSMIPTGELIHGPGSSRKPGAGSKPIYKAPIDWTWASPDGLSPAPGAKLIYYPQYPELRISGFLEYSPQAPREFLVKERRGQEDGRILVLGFTDDGKVHALLITRFSPAGRELLPFQREDSPLLVPLSLIDAKPVLEGRDLLMSELARVHSLEWIDSCQLMGDGSTRPCLGNRCGGHTIEAQLGLTANGRAEPDFAGWELKQYNLVDWHRAPSKPVTLFTPEPDLGEYTELRTTSFVRQYGRQTSEVRHDFTGQHFVGRGPSSTTGLSLEIHGYDATLPRAKDRITSDGRVALVAADGTLAAGWSFAKLLEHWKRKHAQAAYVPSRSRTDQQRGTQFMYGRNVKLGEGTSFVHFLDAMAAGDLFYDPACHATLQANGRWQSKARNQIRIRHAKLASIYDSLTLVDVLDR